MNMKVIKLSLYRLDVYFKNKDKAEMFSNYWKTTYPSDSFVSRVLCVEGMETNCKIVGYNYSFSGYPPKDVIDSYLELFPEEKEDFQ